MEKISRDNKLIGIKEGRLGVKKNGKMEDDEVI